MAPGPESLILSPVSLILGSGSLTLGTGKPPPGLRPLRRNSGALGQKALGLGLLQKRLREAAIHFSRVDRRSTARLSAIAFGPAAASGPPAAAGPHRCGGGPAFSLGDPLRV